mmetsp:Transcript_1777/g.2412  ORF Transcript_1777/g.2412 Transcript_1777/m.2412 type:complete len:146 (+) Transcript_1777:3-440(+)
MMLTHGFFHWTSPKQIKTCCNFAHFTTNIFKKHNDIPDLKEFMRKKRVIQMYRDFLKNAQKFKDPIVAQDIRAQIRTGFCSQKFVSDRFLIKGLLTDASRQLQTLTAMVEDQNSNLDELDYEVGEGWPWEDKGNESISNQQKGDI